MKRFKTTILSLLFAIIPLPILALDNQNTSAPGDSVEISLLTCTPGTEIWSMFGHTAVRWHNLSTGADLAINYGVFTSDTPYFIPRFIFGLTDYMMAVVPMRVFMAEYEYEGRGVIEQKLNLSRADIVSITNALRKNILPENQVYRYNIFYDNCTTRARDIIVDHLSTPVKYPPAATDSCSFREMVHRCNKNFPWTRFGEDLLLGLPADFKTNLSEQQFLPDNLRAHLDKTLYNGKPLVSSSRMILLPQNETQAAPSKMLTPMDVIMILLVVTITLELIEYRKHKLFWGIDLFYMLLTGLPGIIITCMLFSDHPTVSLNLLILILNPLPLFFAYPAIKRTIRHQKFWWWTAWEVMIVLCMIGGFFQTYPSGMIILALLLLTRPLLHHNREREIARK